MKQDRSLVERIWFFLFTVFLAIGAIFFTLNREKFNMDGFNRWLLYGDLDVSMFGESNAFSHAGGENGIFSMLNQGVVMVSQVGSRYYSFTGEVYQERVVNYSNPMLHRGKNRAVLYDVGGRSLVVYGDEKEVFSLGLGGDDVILSARMNQNDWLVTVTRESGYRGVVRVYDGGYQPVMDIALSTTYVMDAVLSPDNKRVAVVTIGQNEGEFASTLYIYDVGSEEPVQALVFPSEVFLDIDYERNRIWILCEKSLVLVNTEDFSKKSWSFSGQYLKDSSLNGEGYGTLLLGQYRAGTADRLVTIDEMGEILGEYVVSGTALSLDSNGGYIAYLTGDCLTIFNSKLEEYSRLEEIRYAYEVAMASEGTVLLASKQEAWLYIPTT